MRDEFRFSGSRLVRWYFLIVTVVVCSCVAREPFDEDQWSTRGAEILKPVKQHFLASLSAGIAESPEQGVRACKLEAPAITREFGSDSVRIGRTSHKLRNPDNRAQAWLTPILEEYLAEPAAATPRALRIDERRVGYAEPLRTAPLCVTCHGSRLDPILQSTIDELYPGDQATGFEEGSIRGVVFVEFLDAHL